MTDWIRYDERFHESIEVGKISIATGVDIPTVVGRLFMAWRWADLQTRDGFAACSVDALTRMIGGDVAFWHAVEDVGWLEIREDGLFFPGRGRKKWRKTPSNTLGFIYYIATLSEDLVKIGYTAGSVHIRLQELQTGSPVILKIAASHRGTMRDERSLHKRFSEFRQIGEWFTYGQEIREWIKSLPSVGR